MEPSENQLLLLRNIVHLLRDTVKDLNLFRYNPMQYDQNYSAPWDKVNPQDKVILKNVEMIDQVVVPIFKDLGIHDLIWAGENPYAGMNQGIRRWMNDFVSQYMRLNFLMDPDNFPN